MARGKLPIFERVSADGRLLGYQVKVRKAGFPSVSRQFDRKADAERYAVDVLSQMSRGVFVDRSEIEAVTLAEALDRYDREIGPTKKRPDGVTAYVRRWKRHPLASRIIATLCYALSIRRKGQNTTSRLPLSVGKRPTAAGMPPLQADEKADGASRRCPLHPCDDIPPSADAMEPSENCGQRVIAVGETAEGLSTCCWRKHVWRERSKAERQRHRRRSRADDKAHPNGGPGVAQVRFVANSHGHSLGSAAMSRRAA